LSFPWEPTPRHVCSSEANAVPPLLASRANVAASLQNSTCMVCFVCLPLRVYGSSPLPFPDFPSTWHKALLVSPLPPGATDEPFFDLNFLNILPAATRVSELNDVRTELAAGPPRVFCIASQRRFPFPHSCPLRCENQVFLFENPSSLSYHRFFAYLDPSHFVPPLPPSQARCSSGTVTFRPLLP